MTTCDGIVIFVIASLALLIDGYGWWWHKKSQCTCCEGAGDDPDCPVHGKKEG